MSQSRNTAGRDSRLAKPGVIRDGRRGELRVGFLFQLAEGPGICRWLWMDYWGPIRDYFCVPKWVKNTLLGAVTNFIPIASPLVLYGWCVKAVWGGENEPEFRFDPFTRYLVRGLWPILASVVVGAVVELPLMLGPTLREGALSCMESFGSRPQGCC